MRYRVVFLTLALLFDFLRVHFWPGRPVCNLADVWITVGVALIAVRMLFFERRKTHGENIESSAAEKSRGL